MKIRIDVLLARLSCLAAGLLLAACAAMPPAPRAPLADHHQHLFSPGIVALINAPAVRPLDAGDLIALLDAAGIRRATVLSVAYMYGNPSRTVADELAKVRAENDWTGAQAAQYPQRLRAFCGVNPLRDYALEEIARCARDPDLRHGLKLHFGNSDVQLEVAAHAEQLRKVFAAANANGMAIAVHMRASISKKRPYGAAQARAFIETLLPAAPDVPVMVAHMASAGPGFEDPPAHEVLGVLAEAMEKRDPRARNLWFDVASNVNVDIAPATAALLVRRMRQAGVDRILYGTDGAAGDNLRPRESWAAFRKLPLTDAEHARIASNSLPWR